MIIIYFYILNKRKNIQQKKNKLIMFVSDIPLSYRLDKLAFILAYNYFNENSNKYVEELLEHKMDPLKNLDYYFEKELNEPIHYIIKIMVENNRGVITEEIIKQWIFEENYE